MNEPTSSPVRSAFPLNAGLLLDHGADPTLADDDGKTALDWAREGGHRTAAALLETALLAR